MKIEQGIKLVVKLRLGLRTWLRIGALCLMLRFDLWLGSRIWSFFLDLELELVFLGLNCVSGIRFDSDLGFNFDLNLNLAFGLVLKT